MKKMDNSKTVIVQLDAQLYEKLRTASFQTRYSMSDIIRNSLKKTLEIKEV